MHGLGNDFVIIDLVTQRFSLQKKHILYIADRHTLGINIFRLEADPEFLQVVAQVSDVDLDTR